MEPPASEISTKRARLAEDERSEQGEEENVWPEPPKRVSPSIRTALVLPKGVTCPDGCQLFSPSEDLDPITLKKLRCAVLPAEGSFHLKKELVLILLLQVTQESF